MTGRREPAPRRLAQVERVAAISAGVASRASTRSRPYLAKPCRNLPGSSGRTPPTCLSRSVIDKTEVMVAPGAHSLAISAHHGAGERPRVDSGLGEAEVELRLPADRAHAMTIHTTTNTVGTH